MLSICLYFSKLRLGIIVSGLMLLMFCPFAIAKERIGLVKTYEPNGFVIRNGNQTPLAVGSGIFQGDIIITDASGAVGIIFSDGAVMTMGPDGKLIIDNFLFNPSTQKVSFISHIHKGKVAFMSGAIGRISPESVQFITPTATLGLRGTKILIEVK